MSQHAALPALDGMEKEHDTVSDSKPAKPPMQKYSTSCEVVNGFGAMQDSHH